LKPVTVAPVHGTTLAEPLALLEESLGDGEPVPEGFADRLRKAVEAGDIEILTARTEDRILGVIVLAYRLNVSAGGLFASIEDLYVRPEIRRQGVGRALLQAAGERCVERGISYVEVQVEDDEAEAFYASLGYEPEPGVRVLSRSLPLSETEMLKPDTYSNSSTS
jgi:GNAT superfamily N-acetyltransferase